MLVSSQFPQFPRSGRHMAQMGAPLANSLLLLHDGDIRGNDLRGHPPFRATEWIRMDSLQIIDPMSDPKRVEK